MQRFTQTAFVLVVVLAVIAGLLVPRWYWDGGLIETEATQFVRQYLDDRSLLQKVFDPHGNDLDTYQARELSYFVDYLDARVFEALMIAGRPILVPASAVVSTALILALSVPVMRRFSASAKLSAALLLLVYVTNYVHVVTMGMLYRSAKPLLAPVLVGTVFYLATIVRDGLTSGRRWTPPVIVFVLFSTLSLLDRQGFFYSIAATGLLAVHAWRGGRRDIVTAGAAAVALMVFYNLRMAPALVQWINGYTPSFEYQRVPVQNLLTDPGIAARAGELVLQSLASLIGGVPPWIFGSVSVLAAAYMVARKRLSKDAALLCGFVVLAQIALVALMIARHPPIYDYYDHRVWYYPLPFQALIVALLIVLIGRTVPSWRAPGRLILNAALTVVVISNVLHWNDYRRAQLRSMWFPGVYMQNLALKASFSDGRARPALGPEFRAFFDFWLQRAPSLRDRAPRAQGSAQ